MRENNYKEVPKISVIIPTYNHGKFICGAIDSVLFQGYPNKEVIVVDDGSTDNTAILVEKYIKLGVKYIYKNNGGLASSRNKGILNTTGSLISFLDADDVWLEDKLLIQSSLMAIKREIGLVGCGYYWTDENLKIIKTVKASNFKDKKSFRARLFLGNIVYGSGSGVLVKRECFDKAGLFDEKLSAVEDWDMWFRIAESYEIRFVEKPLIMIRANRRSMSSPKNADKMLAAELQFLNKLFCDPGLRGNLLLRRKAYSYRYCSAARAYKETGRRKEAARYFFKAFSLFPIVFFNKSNFGLLFWILFGEGLFIKIQKIRELLGLRGKTRLCRNS